MHLGCINTLPLLINVSFDIPVLSCLLDRKTSCTRATHPEIYFPPILLEPQHPHAKYTSNIFILLYFFLHLCNLSERAPYIHRTAKPEQPTVGMEPLSKSNGSPSYPPFRYENRQAKACIFFRKVPLFLPISKLARAEHRKSGSSLRRARGGKAFMCCHHLHHACPSRRMAKLIRPAVRYVR